MKNYTHQTHKIIRHNIFTLTILIMIIGIFSSCNKEIDHQKEEEAIKNVWNKTSEYLSNGDWKNYSNLSDHTEKLQVIHPQGGQWLKGYDEFAPIYKSIVESGSTFTEHKNELLNVNISENGDMAWANAEVIWSMDGFGKKNNMWYALAFEKVEGEWKIVMVMACGVQKAK